MIDRFQALYCHVLAPPKSLSEKPHSGDVITRQEGTMVRKLPLKTSFASLRASGLNVEWEKSSHEVKSPTHLQLYSGEDADSVAGNSANLIYLNVGSVKLIPQTLIQ